MIIAPILIYALGVFIALLGIAVIAFALSYYRLVHQFEQLFGQQFKAQAHQPDQTTTLEKANAQATTIIADAEEKARQLLQSMDVSTKKLDAQLGQLLESAAKKYGNEYQKQLTELQSESDGIFDTILQEIQVKSEDYLKDLNHQTIQLLSKAHKDVEAKLNQAYTDVDAQVSQYREQALTGIRATLNQVAKHILKDVLQRNLTPADQEEFIIQAIQKAKADHVF